MATNRLLALALAGLTFGLGCSSSPDEETPAGADIAFFDALPASIAPGETAVLRWSVTDAASLSLTTDAGAPVELGAAELEAQQVGVKPERTTRYVLSATGHDGKSVTRDTRIAVRVAQPKILSFVATPASIDAGGSVSLSWATENAELVEISAKDGSKLDLHDASPADGSITVRPAASTTYTLRASSITGSATADVDVTVDRGVDVELFADRELVDFGQGTTLRWRSRGANRIVMRVGAEVILDDADRLNGSLAITPGQTTTYEIEAHGDAGTATATAQVRVAPVIEAFGAEGAGPFVRGADAVLAWRVRGADAVRVVGSDGFRYDAAAAELAEGTIDAPVPTDGRVDLEVSLGGESASRRISLPLLDAPQVLSFGVTPTVLTVASGETAEVTLSWKTVRASSLEIAVLGGETVFAATQGVDTGSAKIPVGADTTFVLTARNAAGDATSERQVRAFAPPSIAAFAARPSHVGAGEAFELTWTTAGAASVVLERGGQAIHSATGSGSFTTQIASATTFRLVATNGAGATAVRTLNVTVGSPVLVSAGADRDRYGPGSAASFSWEAMGGTSLVLEGPGGTPVPGCSTTDLDRIPAGTCTVTLPSSLGPRTYTLRLKNTLGQSDARTVDIEIVDGPSIEAFYAETNVLSLGDQVTFHWTTGIDGSGAAPTLALTDGTDVYPLGGANPLDGSAVVTPLRAGTRTFRLTATTAGTAATTRDETLQVYERPMLSVTASSTVFVPGGEPVQLSWQTTHAVQVTIDEEDAGGGSTRIASFVDPALVTASTFDVAPPAPGRVYRVIAANGAGAKATQAIDIGWKKPQIDVFTAAPDAVALGDQTQLQWSATGASSVAITPVPLADADPFLDVSGLGTASEVTLEDCGTATLPTDGCALVQLPFAFPFDGAPRTQARVFLHGVLGFDTSYQGTALPSVQLPSTSASFVGLAPFWQSLRQSVTGSARRGRIFVDQGTGPKGRYAVIQWAGFWSATATSAQPVDLNFEVVLFEDGDFDFRYGTMSGASLPASTDGREASIGWQVQGGAAGRSVLFHQKPDRGLGGVSVGVRLGALPTVGSLALRPFSLGQATYTLQATNPAGVTTATASVTVHSRATLGNVRVVEAFPEPNQDFTVAWTATNATEVRVERPQANPQDPIEVLCSVLPAQTQSCKLQEASVGTFSYVVRAIGAGYADEREAALDVRLYPPFSIDSFTATPTEVATAPGDVTLDWTTTNADTLTLTANGTPVDVSAAPRAAGSVTVEVDAETTFVLTATSQGRTKTATTTVTIAPPPPPDDEE